MRQYISIDWFLLSNYYTQSKRNTLKSCYTLTNMKFIKYSTKNKEEHA